MDLGEGGKWEKRRVPRFSFQRKFGCCGAPLVGIFFLGREITKKNVSHFWATRVYIYIYYIHLEIRTGDCRFGSGKGAARERVPRATLIPHEISAHGKFRII